ncbi:hypothetical protein DRQ32_12425 [bacterium]|nr:MAG: hypothetical protein DRQ32_12425 [bacterium]
MNGAGRWTLLLIACATLGACATLPRASDPAQKRTLIVAVVGLTHDDPILDTLSGRHTRAENVLATGMGATALFELLDGRPALEQLRYPADPMAWARQTGEELRIDALDPAIISAPEWARAGLAAQTTALPDPNGYATWQVIVTGRENVGAQVLQDWLDLADHNTLVLVAGIPRAPRRDLRRAPGGAADESWNSLRVPVLARGRDVQNLKLSGRQTLGTVLADLRGQDSRTQQRRLAHWWNHYGGGILVDEAGAVAVGGSDRDAVWIDPAKAAGSADSVVADASPTGDLLILVRGSTDADLTSLELLTGTRPEWSPWGLESIDQIDHTSPRYLRIDLAAEPEGDGILLHDWSTEFVEIRVNITLEEAPLAGTPVRDAGNGKWLGVDSLGLYPWSRNWWTLTREVDFDAQQWSVNSAAGVDLLWIDAADTVPEPVYLEL